MGRSITHGRPFSASITQGAVVNLEKRAAKYLADAIEYRALEDNEQAKEARKTARRLQLAADNLRKAITKAETEAAG